MAYLPTGNETVALPTLRTEDAGVESINVIHMGLNGLLSFSGVGTPFLRPIVVVDGKEILLEGKLTWRRLADWVPEFTFENEKIRLTGAWVCPPGERGFYLRLHVENRSLEKIDASLGFLASWSECLHTINVTKRLEGGRFLILESWDRMPVMELRAPAPLAALGFYPEDPSASFAFKIGGEPLLAPKKIHRRGFPAAGTSEVFVRGRTQGVVETGKSWETAFFFGLGPDEIGAFASAREMQRMGAQECERHTAHFLAARRKTLSDPHLTHVMNLSAFFNLFYATGLTLDTGEAVALTSRSPRYYVSGAYWDRDSLLWSFPSLLSVDPAWAALVLKYVFKRQGRSFGIHSRYLNGTVLEPGFELDEFCAPTLALARYVEQTGDLGFLKRPEVVEWLDRFPQQLATKRNSKIDLYETWLLPSDDPWPQRYVTYDNVLVWRALTDLAFLFRKLKRASDAKKVLKQASLVRQAILKHCTTEGKVGRMFAWSVDLQGQRLLYDEPPGSLLLLPHYGFCKKTNPVWRATERWIHSESNPYSFQGKPFEAPGCAHAAHPWVLGAANDLLSGRTESGTAFFANVSMDSGIPCESVDEVTGACASGEAFATCAGFVAHALETVIQEKPQSRSKRLERNRFASL
jgi:hypothetical protein